MLTYIRIFIHTYIPTHTYLLAGHACTGYDVHSLCLHTYVYLFIYTYLHIHTFWQAKLAQAMMSIPATKGFEIGSGFAGTRMRGSAHNDMFKVTVMHGLCMY